MQQQQPPPKNQNNMITEIDKIPLKTSDISLTDDMNDPLVKDVLNEFENELLLSKPKNNYKITNNDDIINDDSNSNKKNGYQTQQQLSQNQNQNQPQLQSQSQPRKNNKIKYYDELLINKSFIICVIIAIIINPYIFTTIINNLPENISTILDGYNYIIKLALIFIIIYILMIYKVL